MVQKYSSIFEPYLYKFLNVILDADKVIYSFRSK